MQGAGYGSFVVRWRVLAGDQERIEVEHIQSGLRWRVNSVGAAVDWMAARMRAAGIGAGSGPAPGIKKGSGGAPSGGDSCVD